MKLFGPKTVPCPHCYRPIDLSRVVFRCTGQAQAGRTGCAVRPDSRRQELLDDKRPVRPILHVGGVEVRGKSEATCPDCGARSSIRCCEHCHSVLPSSIQKDSPLIGLVGVRTSGKTVMLSALHTELTQTVARRFHAAIDNPTGASGLVTTLKQNVEEMSKPGGSLPKQNQRKEKTPPAVYEWRYEHRKRMRSILFSFYDNAGEDFAEEDSAMELAYLGQVSGLILLLDPFSFPENTHLIDEKGIKKTHSDTPEQVLASLIEVMRKEHGTKPAKKIHVPVAVVVTKIDAFFDQIEEGHPLRRPSSTLAVFDEREASELDEHMKALVARWGGDGLLRSLDANFTTYRVFGASALGAEPDYENGTTSPRGRLPHRIAEPFLWLLARRGFLPSQKA